MKSFLLLLNLGALATSAVGATQPCSITRCAREIAATCTALACEQRTACRKQLIKDCRENKLNCRSMCSNETASIVDPWNRGFTTECRKTNRHMSTFARIQRRIFNRTCTSSGCHTAATAAGGLALEEARAYKDLVWIRATEQPDKFRVAPADPTDSYLMEVMRGSDAGSFHHAALLPKMDHASLKLLRPWILAGSPRDGIVPGDRGGPPPQDTAPSIPPPPPPPVGDGIQLRFGPFEVPPRSEREVCSYHELPVVPVSVCSQSRAACQGQTDCPSGDSCVFFMKGAEAFMPWPPHHFFLTAYEGPGGRESFPNPVVIDSPFCLHFGPPGSIFNGGDIVRGQTPVERSGYGPLGVAKLLRANQPILLDVHFVNTLNVPLPINLWVNIDFAKPEEVQKLYTGARLQINSAIDVPPCTRSTTCVTWIPTVPVNFFSLWMHSDKAIQSTIDVCNRVINGQCVDVGPRLYDNYDATDPTILRPTEPLRVEPGQGLQQCCTHLNDPPRLGCTGTQEPNDLPGIAASCRGDADCAALAGATGRCEPQPLRFGVRSGDDACLILGYYYPD